MTGCRSCGHYSGNHGPLGCFVPDCECVIDAVSPHPPTEPPGPISTFQRRNDRLIVKALVHAVRPLGLLDLMAVTGLARRDVVDALSTARLCRAGGAVTKTQRRGMRGRWELARCEMFSIDNYQAREGLR